MGWGLTPLQRSSRYILQPPPTGQLKLGIKAKERIKLIERIPQNKWRKILDCTWLTIKALHNVYVPKAVMLYKRVLKNSAFKAFKMFEIV